MSDRVNEALEEVYAFLRQTGRVGITALLDEALAAERATAAVDVERLTENEAHLLISLVNERSKQAEADGVDNGDLYIRLINKLLVFRSVARLSGESE